MYATMDGESDVKKYLATAKAKAEQKAVEKQPKERISVTEYLLKCVEIIYNRKLLEVKLPNTLQTAVSGTEYTVMTNNGKMIHWIHITGSNLFQDGKTKLALSMWCGRKRRSVERNIERHTEQNLKSFKSTPANQSPTPNAKKGN